MKRSLVHVSIVVCALLASGVAAAEPTPADKAAAVRESKKATAEAKAHRYRAAAELLESSYKHSPDPKILFRAASAWQKSNEPAKAANDYARFLKEVPANAPQRDKAKKELDAIGSTLGSVGIKAEGASQVSIDGEAIELPPPAIVYVSAGAHAIEGRFQEKKVLETAKTPPGVLTSVVLKLPVEVAPVAAAPSAAAPGAADASGVDKPTVSAKAQKKPLPPLAVYIGAGATVIAGGLTVFSALDTSSQKTTFDEQPTQENLDSGKSKQLRTNILLAVTGGFAVLTGVAAIFLVDWKSQSKETSVKLGAGPGSFLLRGEF